MTGTLCLVTFRRGGAAYGVELDRVRKVLRAPPVKALPTAPDFVSGGITFEGRLEVLIDLAVLFGGAAEDAAADRVVLVSLGSRDFGFLADGLGEVAEVGADSVQPLPPFLGGARRDAVRGLVVRDREEVLVLDLDRLLDGSELAAVAAAGPGDHTG